VKSLTGNPSGFVIAVTNPGTQQTQYLTRLGVGAALWLVGEASHAVRFATLAEATEAAGKVGRAQLGQCYLVVVLPFGDTYQIGLYTPSTGQIESLDSEGKLGAIVGSETYATEDEALEVAALLREVPVGDLYRIEVQPTEALPALDPRG
jgi:hypothetical protein